MLVRFVSSFSEGYSQLQVMPYIYRGSVMLKREEEFQIFGQDVAVKLPV